MRKPVERIILIKYLNHAKMHCRDDKGSIQLAFLSAGRKGTETSHFLI